MSTRKGNPKKGAPRYTNEKKFVAYQHEQQKREAFKALPDVYGVCRRCKEKQEWKRQYGKYKPIKENAKCKACQGRKVKHPYRALCDGCAGERGVCPGCCLAEPILEAPYDPDEDDELQEAMRHMSERQRRQVLRRIERGLPPIRPKGGDKEEDEDGEEEEEEEEGDGAGDRDGEGEEVEAPAARVQGGDEDEDEDEDGAEGEWEEVEDGDEAASLLAQMQAQVSAAKGATPGGAATLEDSVRDLRDSLRAGGLEEVSKREGGATTGLAALLGGMGLDLDDDEDFEVSAMTADGTEVTLGAADLLAAMGGGGEAGGAGAGGGGDGGSDGDDLLQLMGSMVKQIDSSEWLEENKPAPDAPRTFAPPGAGK